MLCVVSGTFKTGESHNSSVRDIFSCSPGVYLHMCVCVCTYVDSHMYTHMHMES